MNNLLIEITSCNIIPTPLEKDVLLSIRLLPIFAN